MEWKHRLEENPNGKRGKTANFKHLDNGSKVVKCELIKVMKSNEQLQSTKLFSIAITSHSSLGLDVDACRRKYFDEIASHKAENAK